MPDPRAGLPGERAVAVIVNYGDPSPAIACATDLSTAIGRVLVVDNASGDRAVQQLRDAGLEVLARPVNDGFAAGVNAGFAATGEPYVLVLNADVLLRAGAVAALVAHLDSAPRCGVAAPAIVNPDGSVQPSAYRRFPGPATVFCELAAPLAYLVARFPVLDWWHAPASSLRTGARVAWATGAALLVRRAAFEAAGPLDEDFFLYFEDVEFQQRLGRAGFSVEWVAEAVVEHRWIGDEERGAPSPHWLAAADRFLVLAGYRRLVRRLALGGGLVVARLGLRLMALAFPSRRRLFLSRAAAHDALARTTVGAP